MCLRCLDGDTAASAESSEPPPHRFPRKYASLSVEGGEIKEDNETCGEAAAVGAAAMSVFDIEPRKGRTLSAAFDFLAI